MRFIKFAALSLLVSSGIASIALDPAAAQSGPPPAQSAPPPPPQGAPPPPPQGAPPPEASGAPPPAVTHSNVNLRNGPGTNYTVVTLIPAGSSVDVSECQNGWCQVTYQGQNGYIIQSSIAPPAAGASARLAPPPGYAGPPGPPPPGYDVPPPGYYPPPPPYGYYYGYGYGYGPYYGGPYWGGRGGYYRRW